MRVTQTTAPASHATSTGQTDLSSLYPLEELGKKAAESASGTGTSGSARLEAHEDTILNGGGRSRADVPLMFPQRTVEPATRFQILQQYEGVVLSVDDDAFWARLVNKTARDAADEEGEFPLEEVSRADMALVEPGAVFYWNIGYHDSASGQRTRQSVIRFRRLPAFSAEDMDTAREEARRMSALFGEGDNAGSRPG